ncbi:PEX11 domain protein [Aspergillus sp. HF37]|nr:PEX11 domain protein [Aspergillus sp. HF37]
MPQHTLKQFANFTSTSAGLERVLRLVQALVQVAAEVTVHNVIAARCLVAKSQLGLARRYFRFFNFITCFDRVYSILGADFSRGMIPTTLDLARFTALGLYILLEDLTILHALNVWPVPWNSRALVEANRFWFYALGLSVFGAVYELVFHCLWAPKASQNGKREKKRSTGKPIASATPLMKRIAVDGCDLLIPGAVLGWTPFGDFGVGLAMLVSTGVVSRDIWVGVNG